MEWLGYVGTFVLGGSLGTYLGFLIAPRADRDREKLEREKWKAEQQAPARARHIQRLEELHDALNEAQRGCLTPLGFVEPRDFFPVYLASFDGLLEAVQNVLAGPVNVDDAKMLLRAQKALSQWGKSVMIGTAEEANENQSECSVELMNSLVLTRRLLDET